MKNQKGITLISLVVTIVIMAIITGVVSYSGLQSINDTKRMTFISELEMIQAKINVIYEKIKSNENDAKYYNNLGIDCSMMEDEKITTALGETSKEGFRYFSTSDLRAIGLDNINQQVLVNYNTREVVSITGIEIEGVMYYKLKDIPNYTGYNVEHTDTNTEEPTFTVEKTKLSDSYRFTIKDIVYNSNVTGGTLSYKLHSDTNWVLNGDSTSFEVSEPGLYDIRFTDAAGNSTVVQDWFYASDELLLHLDGENNTKTGHSNTTTTWADLSGNGNDLELMNFALTEQSGWASNGLVLDGIDDGVFVGDKLKYLLKDDFTLEVAIKFKGDTARDVILGNYDLSTNIGTMSIERGMGAQSKQLKGRIWYNNASIDTMTTNNIYSLNTNMNIYFILDKSACEFSFGTNGNLKETVKNELFSVEQEFLNAWIGRDHRTGESCLNGTIYSIRIYNRALTEKEIKNNYEIDRYRFNIE